jgi:hypothetical protein
LGKTLIREETKWVIKHKAADYKTGARYGDRAPMEIAPQYTEALDEFVHTWRQHLHPVDDHQYLFMMANGKPPTADTIYQVHAHTSYKGLGEGNKIYTLLINAARGRW